MPLLLTVPEVSVMKLSHGVRSRRLITAQLKGRNRHGNNWPEKISPVQRADAGHPAHRLAAGGSGGGLLVCRARLDQSVAQRTATGPCHAANRSRSATAARVYPAHRLLAQ